MKVVTVRLLGEKKHKKGPQVALIMRTLNRKRAEILLSGRAKKNINEL